MRATLDELDEKGWAVLRDLPFLENGRPDVSAVLAIASAFGVPSSRDGGCRVWPVTPQPRGLGSTFSSMAGSAGLHTDAQYRSVPEELVCMFMVRPAAEGGLTRLLAARDAIEAISCRPDAERLLRLLARPDWRWRVPEEFAGAEDGFRHLVGPCAAVLPGNSTIRWRGDNLSKEIPRALRHLAPVVDQCLDDAVGGVTIGLDPGDLVVADNRRTLHGRTWFDDRRRLLLRVRLWRP
jgi:alpha-ketoglutarate-dependent taurine dioxygenase